MLFSLTSIFSAAFSSSSFSFISIELLLLMLCFCAVFSSGSTARPDLDLCAFHIAIEIVCETQISYTAKFSLHYLFTCGRISHPWIWWTVPWRFLVSENTVRTMQWIKGDVSLKWGPCPVISSFSEVCFIQKTIFQFFMFMWHQRDDGDVALVS